jgi:hypothetical protein
VEDIRQWEVGDHQDIVGVEILAKLPGSDEYTVKYFLNCWVTKLRFREDFDDKVDWPSSWCSTTIAVLKM